MEKTSFFKIGYLQLQVQHLFSYRSLCCRNLERLPKFTEMARLKTHPISFINCLLYTSCTKER